LVLHLRDYLAKLIWDPGGNRTTPGELLTYRTTSILKACYPYCPSLVFDCFSPHPFTMGDKARPTAAYQFESCSSYGNRTRDLPELRNKIDLHSLPRFFYQLEDI